MERFDLCPCSRAGGRIGSDRSFFEQAWNFRTGTTGLRTAELLMAFEQSTGSDARLLPAVVERDSWRYTTLNVTSGELVYAYGLGRFCAVVECNCASVVPLGATFYNHLSQPHDRAACCPLRVPLQVKAPAMVCDVLVCNVWKAGGLFGAATDEMQCGEMTNWDAYVLDFFEPPAQVRSGRQRSSRCRKRGLPTGPVVYGATVLSILDAPPHLALLSLAHARSFLVC